MKKFPLILFFALLWIAACGKSQTNLGQFVGTWHATYSLFDSTGGRVTSGTLTVKQPASDTVTFGESMSIVTGVDAFGIPRNETKSFDVTLKDGGGGNYLLSMKVDGNDILTNFPLKYSESEGFKGQGTVGFDGKQQPLTATIKKDGQGYVWKIASDLETKPKTEYEFTFKDKT